MAVPDPYQELCKLIGGTASKILPRILRHIVDEQEIEILLAAFPTATVPELSAKTGIDYGKAEEMVKTLFLKGMLFLSKKTSPASKGSRGSRKPR